jgi:DNA (cytosine-5)-methyltransferase 1
VSKCDIDDSGLVQESLGSTNAHLNFKKPQVLSFFCGAGGLDLGFVQAGYDVIFAADYDKAAVETHNANVSVPSAVQLDLLSVTPADITKHLSELSYLVSPVGIIGGPPCQGFSRANTQRTHNDPRNELARRYATLIIRLADIYPIQFFVFENVPELLAKKNEKFLNSLKRKLSEKFSISTRVLNAADYGVPQTRERVFIVGVRKVPNKRIKFHFPPPVETTRGTVRSAISHLPEPIFFCRSLKPDDIPEHPNHWTMQPKSRRFSESLVSSGRSLIRLHWDKPSRTVAYGHREIHVHPSGLRRLSIYEAMLLQGFPSTYKLKGNLSQQVTQVSNAVPPPVAKAIAEQLLKYLPSDPSLHDI